MASTETIGGISPYDQAVIDFRAALVDPPQGDIESTLMLLHACQSLTLKRFVYPLDRISIPPADLWKLRGLTFEGEVAALRGGNTIVADRFVGARYVYEDLLTQQDPQDMPQIRSLLPFRVHHPETR